MIKIQIYIAGILLIPTVLFTSCESNRFDVDTSNIETDFQWKRLDKDFYELKNGNFQSKHNELQKEYGTFYKRYIQNILRLGHVSDPAISHPVGEYLNNEDITELYDLVFEVFPDVAEHESELNRAFKYYKYHFPERVVPDAVSFMGAFNYNVAATDSTLGIGLEYYLGSDRKIYKQVGQPMYKVEKMNPEYLVYDAMRGWIVSEFDDPEKEETLIGAILEHGKALYAMDAVFPFAPDHLKIGFKKEEVEWCEHNEWGIWQKMMDSDMLYSKDRGGIKRFTGESPFTPGFSEDSPGRVGLWVGLQIVRKFAERNEQMSLSELMEFRDYKKLLSQSKYKPRK